MMSPLRFYIRIPDARLARKNKVENRKKSTCFVCSVLGSWVLMIIKNSRKPFLCFFTNAGPQRCKQRASTRGLEFKDTAVLEYHGTRIHLCAHGKFETNPIVIKAFYFRSPQASFLWKCPYKIVHSQLLIDTQGYLSDW